MNKLLLIPLLLISLLAIAQDSGPVYSDTIEIANAQVLVKCKEGCLILSPSDVGAIEKAMKQEIQRAYEAGLRGWSKVS